MKISKKQNRICLGLAIAALVAIFCYQVAYGMSETVTNGNVRATLTAPPGSEVTNFTIIPENNNNTSFRYPPPTITYSSESAGDKSCPGCDYMTFTIHDGPNIYQGYRYEGDDQAHPGNLDLCAHKKDLEGRFDHPVKDCVILWPQGGNKYP